MTAADDMGSLHVDSDQIERFVNVLFRYADEGTFVSLRAFDQFDAKQPPFLTKAVAINGSLSPLITAGAKAAQLCAEHHRPIVFAPPIATFSNPDRARGVDLANGLALSVEIDDADPEAARIRLEQILGPVTVAVESGSFWTHPETGECKPKLHLHWRLSEPTLEAEDHGKLRQARNLAAMLVGADPTGKPIVHPLRWPGSWNCKAKPRLARIGSLNETIEIHLAAVLERLAEAVEAAGLLETGIPQGSGQLEAPIELVRSAMSAIPNPGADVHYDDWIRLGYAAYRATGGSEEGFEIWDQWSRKSDKYNAAETKAAWLRIKAAIDGSNAPKTIGAGTIFFQAGKAGWSRPKAEPRKSTGSAEPNTEKPIIRIEEGKVDILATQAEDALIGATADIFQRADHLIRPGHCEVSAADGRTTIAAGLHALNHAALIEELARVAVWQKYDGRSKRWKAANPPSLVTQVLAARVGRWRLRSVAGIITCPTLRPDGSILAASGYDEATRLYHMPDPSLRLPQIADRPTRDHAEASLTLLTDLLREFPFEDAPDRAVALSLIVSAVVRGALGTVPVHAFTAPAPGTGKSYLADVTSAIVSGRFCPVITAGKTEEELEKRLGAMLLAGYPIISLDNISTGLAGDALCQIAERPNVRIRILGKSETPECEFRGIIIANGNNLVVEGDMTRRVLLGKLDAKMERPEERQFRSEPVRQILANRGRYVAAAMTIARAYLIAGQPGKLKPLASYSSWSDLVRSSLVWLGCADPADTVKDVRESDPVLTTLRAVLESWHAVFGEEGRGVQQVVSELSGFDPTTQEGAKLSALRAALAPVATVRGIIDAVKLGYWLRRSKGRPAAGFKFISTPAHGGVASWSAVKT